MKIGIIDTNHFFCIYSLIQIFDFDQNEIVVYLPPALHQRCLQDIGHKSNVRYEVADENETWKSFLDRLAAPINTEAFDYFIILPIYQDYKAAHRLVKQLDGKLIMVVFNLHNWFNPPLIKRHGMMESWYKKQILNRMDWIAIDEHFHNYAIGKMGCKKPILHYPSLLFEPEKQNKFNGRADAKPSFIVPGTIHDLRRDYVTVLEAVKKVLSQTHSFRLVLLGEPIQAYGLVIQNEAAKINALAGETIVEYYEHSFGNEEFEKQMLTGTALIGPVLLEFEIDGIIELYGISKSTGSSFDILAYAIPGIFPEYLSVNSRFDKSTVRYNNADDLADVMMQFIENKDYREQMKNNARLNSSNYTIENVRNRLLNCLRNTCGESGNSL